MLVSASGKWGAILREGRGLTGLWPPDPSLAILLENGDSGMGILGRGGWKGGHL